MKPKLLTADRFVDTRTGCSYRYVYSETEYFRPHYHDYCELFVALEGSAIHLVGEREFRLVPGDMVFIRPSDTHDYISEKGRRFSMVNITFTVETLRELFAYLGAGFPSNELMDAEWPPSVHLAGGELDAFRTRMTSLNAILPGDADELKTALRVMLFEIFTRYFSDYTAGERIMPLWLEELCAEMRKSGGFVEGSEKLFSLTDRSREHVCRSMKKYMGVTVSEFINDLRLHYIANMLRSSNHTVAQIVFESGFNNLSWASEQFKNRYGITMTKYRKSNGL